MRFSFPWDPPPPPPPPESVLDWLRSLLLGAPPSPAPPPPRSLGSVLALLWSRLLGPLPPPPSPPPPPPPPTPSEQPIWLWLMLLFCAIAAAFGLFAKRARWHLHGRRKVVDSKGTHEGNFRYGRPIGLGRYTWAADGHVFDGEFEDGVPNGFGVKSDKNGRLLQCGRWARGLLVESRPLPLTKVIVDPSSAGWAKIIPAASHHQLLLLPGGGHYVGDFSADFRQHGQGTEYRADGTEAARGHWRDGELHGRGRRMLLYGGSCEGEFVDGKMSGLGTFTWPDGRAYEGEFRQNASHGFGIRWSAKGKVLSCGRWINDELVESRPVPRSKIPVGWLLSASANAAPPGRTLLLPSGGHYVGEFSAAFEAHGEGAEFAADGTETAGGQWRDGELHGRGKATYMNVDHYEGEFVAGQMSGLGTYTWASGSVFEGQFHEGEFSGLGILWTAEGEVDECGRWIEDELIESQPVPRSITIGTHLSAAARAADPGRTLLLPDGSHYVGDFNADFQPHGRGTEYRADGSEAASGQWSDGKLHGRGKRTDPNGDRYEGDFVGGVRCGVGSHVHGGKAAHGEWADGRMSGFGLQWNRNGALTECGRWTNARTASLLYPDGRFYRGELNAQLQRHGKGSMHAPNGRLEAAGVWRADRLLTAAENAVAAAAVAMPPAMASSSSSGRPATIAASVSAVTAAPVADIPECVVCQDAPRECFSGCPHVCMCMDCAAQVSTCPMCRAPVNQRLKVFIS